MHLLLLVDGDVEQNHDSVLDGDPLNGYAGCTRMTSQTCSAMCAGFQYFGLQSAGECYCGNSFGRGGKAPESECDSICTGSPIEICGAPSRNSIYAQPPSMYNTTTSSH